MSATASTAQNEGYRPVRELPLVTEENNHMKDPKIILGISEDADFETATEAYNRLKAKYSEDRFLIGEAGNQGARNLTELEEAYLLLKSKHLRECAKESFGGELGDIEQLCKEGKYDEAQKRLDENPAHTAEWHYLQSIVFYKREWHSEAKKQLELAVQLEPDNPKYRNSLDKLTLIMGNPATNPSMLGANQYGANNGQNQDSLQSCCGPCCCDCMFLC